MKSYFLGAVSILSLFSGCTQSGSLHTVNSAPHLGSNSHFEELITPVPANFADADKWNHTETCPTGAVLSPLTRYTFESGQKNHGFKFYYGRACELVRNNSGGDEAEDDDEPGRKLASAGSETDQAKNFSVTLVPHGSFVWWYEDGKRMQSGTFENGTLATQD